MSKVILVMIDALGFESAWDRCGYLGHLVEIKKGAAYRVRGELPAQSRPMYETVLTGLPVSVHGICTNAYTGASTSSNLFSIAKAHKKTTAAAAYKWISELYNQTSAYNERTDRFQLSGGRGDIDQGIFYHDDGYPDSHLYADGDFLARTYRPDFLLIHPMNVDYMGHKAGKGSREYEHAAECTMMYIAWYLDAWREMGYDVLVTADHGMDALGIHYGDTPLQREVPLFVFSDRVQPGNYTDHTISQLLVAPLACALMELPPAPGMQAPFPTIKEAEE